MRFPEVERVLGKAGRAETSTDPAPFSMMETIIQLKPKSEWRKTRHLVRPAGRAGSSRCCRHITPDHISTDQLVAEMNQALQHSGRVERLDHADQEPHRHADHGRAHAGRHQDLRRRSDA